MLSINSRFGYKISIDESYRLIKKSGFDATFLRWNRTDLDYCRQQPDKARNAGLYIENIHMRFNEYEDWNDLWRDNLNGKNTVDSILKSIDDCKEFEIPTMVIHLVDGVRSPACNEIGLERIKRIAEKAENIGVNIALENTIDAKCLEFIFNQIGSPNIGFCYDSGHQHCETPDEDFLGKYGSRLMALHLHDNNGVTIDKMAADQHKLPFDGTIDWAKIMTKISKYNYKGFITLEVYNRFYPDLSFEKFLENAFVCASRLEKKYIYRV